MFRDYFTRWDSWDEFELKLDRFHSFEVWDIVLVLQLESNNSKVHWRIYINVKKSLKIKSERVSTVPFSSFLTIRLCTEALISEHQIELIAYIL